MLFTHQMLGLVRGITTGGSTVHYYATSFPVPFDMLKSHGIDISNEVKELREELPVAPLKDEMVGPMSKRIMDSAQDLGYSWKKLDKFMYQDRWKPEYKFGHYGDPYGVKWSARIYVEEAVAKAEEAVERMATQLVFGQVPPQRKTKRRRGGPEVKVVYFRSFLEAEDSDVAVVLPHEKPVQLAMFAQQPNH